MSVSAARTSDGSECSEFRFERNFALRFYESVGTSAALGMYAALSSGDIQSVCSFSVDPSHYQEPKHFAEDYQVAELLRKSLNLPGFTDETREAKALEKFISSEEHNARTNDRLWAERLPDWFGEFSHQVLRILGPLGRSELDAIADLGKFGPGACVGVRTDGLVPSIKYEANPVATKSVTGLINGIMPAIVLDYKSESLKSGTDHSVRGNRHFTVPKNFEINRCAACEPVWNTYLQQGIGRFMTRRLKRFGVDLHDQRLNQFLAEMAMEWGLATIDLSSASDMMSRNLVLQALRYNEHPEGARWFHLLNTARSPEMKIGKEWRSLEMFSSMGNGFTFPLETIIFLALVRARVPSCDWSMCTAYGDDIIVPQRHANQVIEGLVYLGFKVNSKKTCLAGAFFESCGTDWFNGRNVRPFYLHQEPNSPIPYALQAANALRAWCLRVYGYLPGKFKSLWLWCKGQVPAAFRYPVPKELGDVGLHTSCSDAVRHVTPARASFMFHEGYLVRHAMLRPVNRDRGTFGVLASVLSSVSQTGVPATYKSYCGKVGARVLMHPAYLRADALLHQRTEPKTAMYGLEPMRGLYGKVRTETAVVLWWDDFSWDE